jgi:hypothetical protein
MAPAATFWNWFKANNASYIALNNTELTIDEKEIRLDELLKRLHIYCNKLFFEIGGIAGEKQELIITAEGNTNYFDDVEKLIEGAPQIENWTLTALLQPRDLDYTSNFEDVELKPFEMWFLPLNSKSQPKSIGIKVCLPNYESVKDSKWLKAAVYKVLDTALGEKVFALDITHIEIGSLPELPENHGMIELKDISMFIKWKKKKLASG